MNIKHYSTAADLLSDKRLIQGALPSVDAVLSAPKSVPIRLVYGETFDAHGLTVDSLKYYFFTALLGGLLEREGYTVTASVITGDLHSIKNKIVADKDGLLGSAAERSDFMTKIKDVFGLRFDSLLMSDLFESDDYKKRLATITPIFQNSAELQAVARKTVLVNRLAQEEKSGFAYTLEEVALITGFDIKIGPPREQHYDKLARTLGPEVGNADFRGLYLAPTYPLGLGLDYFVTHPEIEEFGLTPYKAGSNQLQDSRIVLGVTTAADCKRLIDTSFVAKNPILPNPVLDIYIIAQLAEAFLTGNNFEIDEDLLGDPAALKIAAYEKLIANVYKPLGLA